MDVRVGLWRKLSAEELMLLNCGVGVDSWESLGLQWRSNQLILKEISPEYPLEGPMLKLKLQYFGHLMRRTDSLEKTLILGKIEGKRRRRWQRKKWLDGIIDSMDMSLSKFQGVGDAIQPSHPLLSPSPPALNHSQYQGLFKWVSSSHQVARVLEFQHQSFQRIFSTDFF